MPRSYWSAANGSDSAPQRGSSPAAEKTDAKNTDAPPAGIVEAKDIAEEAYIYGFPMIAAYKAMYQFNVDRESPPVQRTFQPCSEHGEALHAQRHRHRHAQQRHALLDACQADLRAEPLVLSVPAVEKDRYYSVQLTDMYACNYGYIGSRATGNAAGHYLVAGPDWKGRSRPRASTRCFAAKPSSA